MKKLIGVLVVGVGLLTGCMNPVSKNLNSTLVGLFAEKYQIPVTDVKITIDDQTDHHVHGSYRKGDGPGNAGGFLASDMLGKWEIVWDGSGTFDCDKVAPYNFPSNYIKGCTKAETGHEPMLVGIIRDLFLQEDGFKNLNAADVKIDLFPSDNNNYAKGTVAIGAGGPGNEGGFLATDHNQDGSLGEWKLVWHGNGVLECSLLESYGFPESMKEGCYGEIKDTVAAGEDIVPVLQQLFADKYQEKAEDVIITVTKQITGFAKGGVNFVGQMEGGMFMAAEVNGKWVLVWDGNGTYDCSALDSYGFPLDWKEGC